MTVTEAIAHIQNVLGAGCWNSVMAIGQLLSGLVVALVYSWDVGLIALAVAMLALVPAWPLNPHHVLQRPLKLAGGSFLRPSFSFARWPTASASWERRMLVLVALPRRWAEMDARAPLTASV